MLRRRRQPPDPFPDVDLSAISPRFAGYVAGALDARRRYGELVAEVALGPVRDKLTATGEHLDAGVRAVWDTARRASEVEHALEALEPQRVTQDYKRARRTGTDPTLEAALGQRFASVQRLLNAVDDTDQRLRLLRARLDAAVASAAEIALTGGLTDEVAEELDGVVEELGALGAALESLR